MLNRLLLSLLFLFLGLVNYFLFRPNIIVIKYLSNFGLPYFEPINFQNHTINIFFKSYVSDILWCLFIINLAITLLQFGIQKFYVTLLLLLPFLSEFLQLFDLIPGKFDLFDLFTYVLLNLIYFKQLKTRLL